MIKITEEKEKLIIENYQNKPMNLTWLDVVDNLENYGLFIRAKNNGNVVATYNKKNYIVEDKHINDFESMNRTEFILC